LAQVDSFISSIVLKASTGFVDPLSCAGWLTPKIAGLGKALVQGVQDTAVNVASDGIKTVSSQVAQIQAPPFLKDLFTPDKAAEIQDTVSKGI
jgi:hypothetical protein